MIAETPTPPYYAVIFTSIRTEPDPEYGQMAQWMHELASTQEGFLGLESARESIGITVSYWRDLDSVKRWKYHADHLVAQKLGRERWYRAYKTRICLVEREYGFGQ